MIAGQLHRLKKIIICAFLLAGVMSGSSLAGVLVDLDQNHKHPLGKILGNKAGDQAYFSLGNGRAIKISLAESSRKEAVMLKSLVLNRAGGSMKPLLVKRRNLKW